MTPARLRWRARKALHEGKQGGEVKPSELKGPKPLEAVVNVRLTRAEKARLVEEARLAGLTVSALVRRRAFGRPIVASADLAVIRELRRLGGLLKHLHNQSGGAHAKETSATLGVLKSYLDKLSRGGNY